jgi:beta-glucanase (GH16 family)
MSASRLRRYGGRTLIAAVFSALLLPGVAIQAGASSAPVANGSAARSAPAAAGPALLTAKKKSSWKTARIEEFSGSKLPDGCDPYSGKFPVGKGAWASKNATVSSGLLQLKLEKKKTSGQPYTSGGMACLGWGQKYGRYEIKAKVPVGAGINSTIALFPTKPGKTAASAWTGVELLAPRPDTAYVTNGYGAKSETAQVVGEYGGAFHTYVLEWAPKHLRMTVDGKQIYYSTKAFKSARWFAIVVSNGDKLTGVPNAATKLPARLQIDRVKVSTYTGVPPKAGTITPPQATPTSSTPTPAATTAPPSAANKVPATSTPASVTPVEPTSAETGPVLAGGIWPWLLGGSLIAVFAIASLNYPHHRRSRRDAGLSRQ